MFLKEVCRRKEFYKLFWKHSILHYRKLEKKIEQKTWTLTFNLLSNFVNHIMKSLV